MHDFLQINMSDCQWQKDNLSDLISSFPREIQGLLGYLNSSTCDSHSFKRFYEEKTEICWITFVNHLIKNFPVVIRHVNLYFKPKLLLFPLHLQRNILSILLSNAGNIPIESLRKLDEILNEWKEQMNEWTRTIHKLLKVKIAELQNEDCKNETMVYVDVFTDKSRPQFQELCTKIKSVAFDNVQDTNISWAVVESSDTAHCTLNDVCTDNSLQKISVDVHDDCEKPMDVDMEIIDPGVQILHTTSTANSNILPEPPTELHILDDKSGTELQSKLKRLQEIIQTELSTETSQVPNDLQNELQVFVELPGVEMEDACNFLGLSDLCNENTVAILIQAFVKINPEPSYQNTNIFALKVILPSLQKISCPVSRLLGNSVMMFCEKFSSIACNLLFQLLINPSLNTFQADFICKVIREKFNNNSKMLLMLLDRNNSMGAGSFYWNELIVTIVQAIVDSNVISEQETLHTKFVNVLEMNATGMAKSLKFAKLVVSIIRKYGQLVSTHKQSFITILDRNETFLKKSGMALLKNIK